MKPERLESRGGVRRIDEVNMRVTSVISTGDPARDGAIIDPLGWDFTNYDRNPVVLWGHNDSAVPIAKTIERHVGTEGLIATAEFDCEDPKAIQLFGKVARGYVNAASVRWLPKRTEIKRMADATGVERDVLIFREQELLEWSFVTIPADVGAVVLRKGRALDVPAFVRSWQSTALRATSAPQLVTANDDARALAARIRRLGRDGPGVWWLMADLADADEGVYRTVVSETMLSRRARR